jgi:hypothetical protein
MEPVTVTLKPPFVAEMQEIVAPSVDPRVILLVGVRLGRKPQLRAVAFTANERLTVPANPWRLVALILEVALVFAVVVTVVGLAVRVKSWIV